MSVARRSILTCAYDKELQTGWSAKFSMTGFRSPFDRSYLYLGICISDDVVVEVGFQLQLASAKYGEVHIRFKASQRSSCSVALHIYMYNIITVVRTSQVGACNNSSTTYKSVQTTTRNLCMCARD